jgi:hypothetical protein
LAINPSPGIARDSDHYKSIMTSNARGRVRYGYSRSICGADKALAQE